MQLIKQFCLLSFAVLALAGCCDEKRIPDHIQALYSSNPRERNQATLDLARCGSAAQRAVPRLIQMIYDENVGVQSGAVYALTRIDTTEARAAVEAATRARRK